MNTYTKNNNFKAMSTSGFSRLLILLLMLCISSANALAENVIESIQHASIEGNRLQVILKMSEHAVEPLSFTIDDPARIAFDFSNTGSKLPKKQQPINVGIAQSVTAVSAKGRTRVILNLIEVVPYHITTEGNNVIITLDSDASGSTVFAADDGDDLRQMAIDDSTVRYSSVRRGINNVDFRRGELGEGRIIVTLTETNIPMDISEEFGKVIVKFLGAQLPEKLRQTLDVLDFATPVKSVSSFEKDGNVRIEIIPSTSEYEHVAYQANNIFTIELKPLSKEEEDEQNKAKFGYTGERLSLNFQDIPVRAVLQLIADFTGLNVVVSDSVDGNLTLRLKNVPWDQALAIILKAKGLSKRESGNVMLVAPSEEIAAQEKIDLEAAQAVTELAPLRSVFFTINFAKVKELEVILTSGSDGGGEEGAATGGILSPRGSLVIDERTNTIIIKDTEEVLSEVRRIINKLDVPIRQVLISSRIVIATDDFSKELGSRFGVTNAHVGDADSVSAISGSVTGTDTIISSAGADLTNISTSPLDLPAVSSRLGVNLPAAVNAGSIAFSVLNGGSLIDLEISALQTENKGEVISSPRVVTSDRHEAFIEQGVEIPYLTASSAGSTTVEFKKAILGIKVTPQITPDDKIIMDLEVKKDSVGEVFAGIPSIDTREVSTQVLVNNGDTIVLGGVYEQVIRDELDKVPVLGDIPILGFFFRHTLESDEKAELLIFVTPKILKESLTL